eukprot:4826-Heterococcus_DN1.PRE.1
MHSHCLICYLLAAIAAAAMCVQGDGDALAASDLRDKVRRLEYIDSVHTTTIAGHTTYASVSATTANATMLLMQQHSAITLLLLCHRSCLYTLLQTACNAPCKHAAVAERDTEIKALKSLREHSVAVQVEAMVSKRAMEEAREDAEQLRTELGKREGLLQELLQSQARYSSEVEQLRAALRDAGADADSSDDLDNSTTNDDGDSDNGSVTPAVRFNVSSAEPAVHLAFLHTGLAAAS